MCAGQNLVLDGNPTGGSGTYTVHDWTNTGAGSLSATNVQSPTFNNAIGGTYDLTYTVTDDNGCTATDDITVTVFDTPVIDPISDTTVCESFTFPAIGGTNITSNATYWETTIGGVEHIVGSTLSTPGTYTIIAEDGANGCSDADTFQLVINVLPTVTGTAGSGTYCEGDPITDITVDVTGNADWTIDYTLDGTPMTATGSTSTISLGTTAGVYVITGVTDANCTNSATGTETIVINAYPPAPTAGTDAEYCSTENFVAMTASGTGGTLTWYIDAGLTSQVATGGSYTPENTVGQTVYYITETSNGCEGPSSQVIINVIECDIIVPTAFTPDGDMINDFWEIQDIDQVYPDNVVYVYNRWGSLLYTDPNNEEVDKINGTISIIKRDN